jgi:hypothetical protein
MTDPIWIKSGDFWVKVVDMLQQNWALIEIAPDTSAQVFFINDTSGIFDDMRFPSPEEAERALNRNGFRRFAVSPDLESFLRPPLAPFHRAAHPNGPIYSSGRFWRE